MFQILWFLFDFKLELESESGLEFKFKFKLKLKLEIKCGTHRARLWCPQSPPEQFPYYPGNHIFYSYVIVVNLFRRREEAVHKLQTENIQGA